MRHYHYLGPTAGQGDERGQVRAVNCDGAGGAVQLQFRQLDVGQTGHWKHQTHLCVLTRQYWKKYTRHRFIGFIVDE